MSDLTVLLNQARDGDADALDRVFEALYDELAVMARSRLRRGERVTLADTGALVHESWMRLRQSGRLSFEDRGHFLAHAAQVMRSVIVDIARRSQAQRRGGDQAIVTLDTAVADGVAAPGSEPDVMEVSAALDELARLDARLARVVEMRWFGGVSEVDIAEALGVSERTVRRDWDKARAFLRTLLRA